MQNILLLDTACCDWFVCPWWLFWTAVAALLGGLIHWLMTRGKDKQIADLTVERDGYHAKFTNSEKDLASIKYQLDEANKHIAHLKGQLSICEADKATLNAKLAAGGDGDGADLSGGALGFAAGVAAGERNLDDDGINYTALLGSDNLQIVEGVGPKIDGLLKDGGINNWSDLAGTSVERLQEILDAAGSRYRLANPKTWPQQAKLAHEGKWDELIEYQKFLDAGVENKGDFESPAKVEKLIAKLLGFSTNPNDLKVVEGVGPKIEGLMKDAGINTWSELAATEVSRLQEILNDAGDRYRLADPSTWPKQAGLAAEGKWDELKSYQDFLSGGKNPN